MRLIDHRLEDESVPVVALANLRGLGEREEKTSVPAAGTAELASRVGVNESEGVEGALRRAVGILTPLLGVVGERGAVPISIGR
jgi:hypothetical protein